MPAVDLRKFATRGYVGRKVTMALVDEAQDLLSYQILLFRCACEERHRYAFAADTACGPLMLGCVTNHPLRA